MSRTVSAFVRAPVAIVVLSAVLGVGAHAAADDTLSEDRSVELGGHVGVTTGGGASPGGFDLGGNYLYRLSGIDWFEGSLRVVIGSGKAACFTDRQGEYLCTHGPVAGRFGELSAGVRRYLLPQDSFTPYAQLRVGLRVSTFPGDSTTAIAVPFMAGFGVRGQVNELVAIGGGATLEGGASLFSGELGLQPLVALAVQINVEFTID